uniref:U1 small nuclear ribonucleoprotein 70 kDa n=1 Tax=Panagrellus redivivus TaxID=6233 RepID=A0A7E4ZRW8_PANRE
MPRDYRKRSKRSTSRRKATNHRTNGHRNNNNTSTSNSNRRTSPRTRRNSERERDRHAERFREEILMETRKREEDSRKAAEARKHRYARRDVDRGFDSDEIRRALRESRREAEASAPAPKRRRFRDVSLIFCLSGG